MEKQSQTSRADLSVPLSLSQVFPARPNIQPYSCLFHEVQGRLPFPHHYEVKRRSDGSFVWTLIDEERSGPIWRFLVNHQLGFSGYVLPELLRYPFVEAGSLPKVSTNPEPGGVLHTVHALAPRQETWLDTEKQIYRRELFHGSNGTFDWRVDQLSLTEPEPGDFSLPQVP